MKTNRTKAVDPTTAHTLLIVMETRPVLAEASEINENTTIFIILARNIITAAARVKYKSSNSYNTL